MAVVSVTGKLNAFITTTANLQWLEITGNFPPIVNPLKCLVLTTRVFKRYFKYVLGNLCQHDVLDKTVAYVYVTEVQKRGYANVHLLLTLSCQCRVCWLHSFSQIPS